MLVLALVTVAGINSQADVADKLALYLPNRIIDLTDIFSIEVGFGPAIRAEVRATRAFAFGGGVGIVATAVKDYNRQYGACLDNGWDGAFTCVAIEDSERTHTTRWVKEYWEVDSGIPLPDKQIYNFYTGARDYWELGVDFSALIHFHFALHPVDIADFVTGWFFIDLKGDDFTSDDL
jgi:hypothetical protein